MSQTSSFRSGSSLSGMLRTMTNRTSTKCSGSLTIWPLNRSHAPKPAQVDDHNCNKLLSNVAWLAGALTGCVRLIFWYMTAQHMERAPWALSARWTFGCGCHIRSAIIFRCCSQRHCIRQICAELVAKTCW